MLLSCYLPKPLAVSEEEKAVQEKFKEMANECIDLFVCIPAEKRRPLFSVFGELDLRGSAEGGCAKWWMALQIIEKLKIVHKMVSSACDGTPLDRETVFARKVDLTGVDSQALAGHGFGSNLSVVIFGLVVSVYNNVKSNIMPTFRSGMSCSWDVEPHKQPWPPPVQFVILGDGATTRFQRSVCTSLMLLDSEGLQFLTVDKPIALYIGPAVGGLLNATFGNATEMIIAIYALQKGMFRVVWQSLLCSILSNMLLVMNWAFFAGGIVHRSKDQAFSKASAALNSGFLLMAILGLRFPAVLHFTPSEVRQGVSEVVLSSFSSCIILVTYASDLYFQLSARSNIYSPIGSEDAPNGDNQKKMKKLLEYMRIERMEFIVEGFMEDRMHVLHTMQIGYNATISAPHMHAVCLELLEKNLQPGVRALDVGSGMGVAASPVTSGKGTVSSGQGNFSVFIWDPGGIDAMYRLEGKPIFKKGGMSAVRHLNQEPWSPSRQGSWTMTSKQPPKCRIPVCKVPARQLPFERFGVGVAVACVCASVSAVWGWLCLAAAKGLCIVECCL